MRVILPDAVTTYDLASDLGSRLDFRGQHEEAKVLKLAALEGRRRVLEEEHKDTFTSLCNIMSRWKTSKAR